MNSQLAGQDYGGGPRFTDTLAWQIRDGAEQCPDATLIELLPDGRPEVKASYGQLYSKALRMASRLADVDPDAPLILCFERAVDFIPAAWAAISLGRWYIPWQIQPAAHLGGALRARFDALRECFAQACLVTRDIDESLARSIRSAAPGWSRAELEHIDEQRSVRTEGPLIEGGGCYLPTSGSSGGARFARIRNRTLCARNDLSTALTRPKTSQVSFPFDGVTGHSIVFPWSGTQVFLHTSRIMTRPDDLPDLLEHHRINSLSMSSSMLARLVHALETRIADCDLSALRRMSLGSEPLSASLITRMITQCRRFGADGPRFDLGYGMTETGFIAGVGFPTPEEALERLGNGSEPVRFDYCSRFTGLRIADPQDRCVPAGMAGEIQIHAPPRLFEGYQTADGLDRSGFTADGWFRTGDLGRIDSGLLVVLGRESGSMKVGGRRISLEQIETALQGADGLVPGTLVAAAVRPNDADADELALFFSPMSDATATGEGLGQRLRRAVVDLLGIAPRHLVALEESHIPRTGSAKVIRSRLARAYVSGALGHAPGKPDEPAASPQPESSLRRIWARTLGIDSAFPAGDTFFELGADSLAVAEMIFQVERAFGIRVPLETFFGQPTLATLIRHIETSAASAASATSEATVVEREDNRACATACATASMRRLESALSGWAGQRRTAQQLIPGLNQDGKQAPLVWVFQSEREFVRLGGALGPDRPLFGLRSLVGIQPVRGYDHQTLDAVCDLYIPHLHTLIPQGRLILGGNCQAAIIALALARRLRRLGRCPEPLILMEWMYAYGPYEDRVELLFGAQSHTAGYYASNEPDAEPRQGPDWKRDFPARGLHAISGRHGAFFQTPNIDSLAATIAGVCNGCTGTTSGGP